MSAETNSSTDELDPDEPRTPLWLPLLGLGLFLTALVYFLVSSDDASEAAPRPTDTAAPAPEAE